MPTGRAESWLVVGGGTGGMAGAALLAARGHDVTLVEAAPGLGHAASGFSWQGFSLDYGCHVFGNETADATERLVALAGGDVRPVSVATASVHNGRLVAGTELPDLEPLGDVALAELLRAAAADRGRGASLASCLVARFGPRVAAALGDVAVKMFGLPPDELAPEARRTGPFGRVRLVPERIARILKQAPELDARIAAAYPSEPRHFYPESSPRVPARSFYPARGGMRAFALAAEAELHAQGVTLALGSEPAALETDGDELRLGTADGRELAADRLLWTSGLPALDACLGTGAGLERHVHRVPMVLYYFALPREAEGPYDYVHDFERDDLLFRASLPGRYGRDNAPPGLTALCCEVPTTLASEVWHDPDAHAERVLEEARRHGIVGPQAPIDQHVKPIARTYKLPRRGYAEAARGLAARVADEPRLVVPEEWAFTASGSVRAAVAALKERL